MAANRAPDLVILCSRRPNTVTARVYGGVLVPTNRSPRFPGHSGTWDLRQLASRPAGGHVERVRCHCGSEHGWWSAHVLLEQRGKIMSDDLEILTRDYDEQVRRES